MIYPIITSDLFIIFVNLTVMITFYYYLTGFVQTIPNIWLENWFLTATVWTLIIKQLSINLCRNRLSFTILPFESRKVVDHCIAQALQFRQQHKSKVYINFLPLNFNIFLIEQIAHTLINKITIEVFHILIV